MIQCRLMLSHRCIMQADTRENLQAWIKVWTPASTTTRSQWVTFLLPNKTNSRNFKPPVEWRLMSNNIIKIISTKVLMSEAQEADKWSQGITEEEAMLLVSSYTNRPERSLKGSSPALISMIITVSFLKRKLHKWTGSSSKTISSNNNKWFSKTPIIKSRPMAIGSSSRRARENTTCPRTCRRVMSMDKMLEVKAWCLIVTLNQQEWSRNFRTTPNLVRKPIKCRARGAMRITTWKRRRIGLRSRSSSPQISITHRRFNTTKILAVTCMKLQDITPSVPSIILKVEWQMVQALFLRSQQTDNPRKDSKARKRSARRPRSPDKEAPSSFLLAHPYKMCHNWNLILPKEDIRRTRIKIQANNFRIITLSPTLVVLRRIRGCTLSKTQAPLVLTCREDSTLLQTLPCNNRLRSFKYTNSPTQWADMAPPVCKKWSIRATSPITAGKWSPCCKVDNNNRLVITREHPSSNKWVETVISMLIRFSWTVIRAIITRLTVKIMILIICKMGQFESSISLITTLEEQIELLPENNLREEPSYKENWVISRWTKVRWIKLRRELMVWFHRSTKSLNKAPRWETTKVFRISAITTALIKPQRKAFSISRPIHLECWTALVTLIRLPKKDHQRTQLEGSSMWKLLVSILLRWPSPWNTLFLSKITVKCRASISIRRAPCSSRPRRAVLLPPNRTWGRTPCKLPILEAKIRKSASSIGRISPF